MHIIDDHYSFSTNIFSVIYHFKIDLIYFVLTFISNPIISAINSRYALEEISNIVGSRVHPEEQSDRMTDIWPIDKIWSFIKEKLKREEIQSVSVLKNEIVKIWRPISPQMCSYLINSIPSRLQCLIEKKDYNDIKNGKFN